jgi:hypothetical protein
LAKKNQKYSSDMFRSQLARIGGLELVSSSEVNKLDPDAIQKSGCTKDECAVMIAD